MRPANCPLIAACNANLGALTALAFVAGAAETSLFFVDAFLPAGRLCGHFRNGRDWDESCGDDGRQYETQQVETHGFLPRSRSNH
jgi:hypothetical protein